LSRRQRPAILVSVRKMRGSPTADLALCGRFHRAIELIGRRWTGAIVFLLLRSRCRYATLRDAVPDITDRMLSERLQELEEEGIVKRTVIPATPVRVKYALTKKGRDLASAIDAMAAWAERWIEPAARTPKGRVVPRTRQAS
jgi:DNA-binding HxlR family transcriptional regulator